MRRGYSKSGELALAKGGYLKMKSNAPWSVKGIERDARETAKDAAKRKGLTVGEWLNQMIYTAGDPQSSGGEVEGLKLRDIITAIEHLHKQVAQTHAAGAENVSEVTHKIGDMVERVQRLERVKPASGGDSDIAARIQKLEADSNDRERINALKALEKAVTQVAVQFNTAQKMTIERLDASERQLQEFAERVDGGDGGGSDLGFVKDAIDGLSARIARTEKLASEAAAQTQGASGGADPAFVESTGNRLRVLGDEIKRSGDQIRTFENTIAKLSGQIDAAERRNAEGLQKVMETLAELQSNSGKQAPSGASRKEIDVAVAAAARETDARFEKLQSSVESLTKRLETSGAAPVVTSPEQPSPLPASTEPAPAEPDAATQAAEPSDDAKDQDATGKSPLSSLAAALGFGDKGDDDKHRNDKDRDEAASDDTLSAAVKASAEDAAPQSDEDPFSFADEIDAALDEVSAGDDAKDDFSFELDDEPRGAVEDAVDNDADAEAQALLSEVHGVFGMNPQDGASAPAAGDGEIEPDARDDLDQILSDLDDMTGDVQPGLASELDAPDTNNAPDTPDTDDEREAEERARQQAMSLLFGEQDTQAEAPEEKSEDYLQAARRQARDAAARAQEDKKPRRRKLTPKQKAILVARARKKRLAEARGEAEKPIDPVKVAAAKEALQEAAIEPRAEPADDDERPSGGFAALVSKLPFMGAKTKSEETAPEPQPPETEEARLRNGDRAAFETLKATASARPLTLALIVGIFLSLAVLFFMVKDIVFKSPDAADRGGVVATSPVGDAPPATENTLDVPNVPTIDPRALYSDAMAGLGAAETDAESAAAIAKLREAAALGHPPAQLQLGEFYKTGQGVDVDLGRARTWFRRAANGGNVLAMHRIGIMTARGEGGPADAGEAIGWFELAANRGLVDSQYNLGAIFHPTGDGTPSGVQDAGKAYYWYSLAASNGDEQAIPLAASVASALSTDQKAELDKSIAEWQARTPDAQANEIAPAG
jgi:localization factor PodJL